MDNTRRLNYRLIFAGVCFCFVFVVQSQQKWIPLIQQLDSAEEGTEAYGTLAVQISWELNEADPDSAAYYGKLGLETGLKLKNDSIIARALLGLSVVDSYKGMHAEAIKKSYEALKVAEGIGDTITMADAVNNIGIDMYYQGDLESALKYYELFGEYALAINNLSRYANSLNNMALIEEERGNVEKEIEYYQKAIEIFYEIDQEAGAFNTKINLARTYALMGRNKEASVLYKECYDYFIEAEYTSALGEVLTFWADLHFVEKQYNEAIEKLKESVSISIQTNNTLQEMFAYEVFHKVYEEIGNFKMAYQYFQKYHELLLESREEQKLATIEELRAEYDSEKKEQKIERLEQDNQIKALQAKQDAQTRLILIIVLIALLVIAVLFYSRFRNKAKTNELLDAKNNELANLNKTKDRLFSIISHDLKSPLSSFHTITKSLTDNWEQLDKEQLRSFVESLRDSSANVRDMMENLLKWALTQTDQLGHKSENVNVVQVLERVQSQLHNVSELKKIVITKNLEKGTDIKADSQFVEIVIRNILSNALKFSSIGGEIAITMQNIDSKQTIAIQDHGVGMNQLQIDQLIRGEILANDIQNSSEKGTGLGLTLSKELMDKMGAELSVESEKSKGTTFKLTFDQAA